MKALNAAPVRQAMFAGRKRWWNLLSYAPKDFTARLEPPPQPNFALLVIFVKKDQLSLFSVLLGITKATKAKAAACLVPKDLCAVIIQGPRRL